MLSDQATRLREMAAQMRNQAVEKRPARITQVIAITSGKGGVGKTNVSVNVAQALKAQGKDVIVWDADLGFANADILLGTAPPYNLGHLISGERSILEVIHETPTGIKLIAGGSGLGELSTLGEEKVSEFLRALQQINGMADYILLDTGAGWNKIIEGFTLSADQIVVVITPEPTAVADAYGLIKMLDRRRGNHTLNIKLVVNMADSMDEAKKAADALIVMSRQFLSLQIELLGVVLRDEKVTRAVRERKPFYLTHPSSPPAQSINQITAKLTGLQVAPTPQQVISKSGGGFFDKLKSFFS